MIKPLEYHVLYSLDGSEFGRVAPDVYDITDKLNEVIKRLNELEGGKNVSN